MPPSAAAVAHAAALANQSSSPSSGPEYEALMKNGAMFAKKKVERSFANSSVVDCDKVEALPTFDFREITRGRTLGRGGFGVVDEIRGFRVSGIGGKGGNDGDEEAKDDVESKAFIAEHCLRNNSDARYAVKYLAKEIVADPAQFIQGIVDMSVETHFLSAIEHPNIIKLRAIASCDKFDPKYFIVLDRLYDTLEVRLGKWKKRMKRSKSILGKMTDKKGKKVDGLLEERLVAAFDLSAALEYLHGLNVVYRDLKPENIGFDVRGDVKIFDFGLAKELHPASSSGAETDNDNDNETYKLTGDTGSLRYMAPEVAKNLPYNFTVDTYSFAILLWEMMSLNKPFSGYSTKMHADKVVNGGHRPSIDPKWSISVRHMLQKGWSEDIKDRPPMASVTKILKKEVSKLRGGDETGLEHMQRRSTYVVRKKK